MERKRLCSSSFWEEEEEDKEAGERISPGKRKGVTRRLVFKEEEGEHNQMTHENNLWLVTCGTKSGILDVEKLDRSEPCIECEGCWCSPHEFEKLAGKGSSKKWKTTIFFSNKPLQFWFEEGCLTTKGYRKRRTKTAKKIPSSNSEFQELSEEDSEEDNAEDEDEYEEEEKDEAAPAVASDQTDNSVIKERTSTSTISTPGKCALKMKEIKCIVNRLPEKSRGHIDMPRSEVAGNTRDVATNTTVKQQNVQEELKEETNEEETEELPVETEHRNEQMREEAENEREVVNSGSEVSGNTRDVTSNTETKEKELTAHGPSFEPLTVLDGCGHTDVPCSGHNAAELQVVRPDMSSSRTSQTSDGINSSHKTGAPSQWPSANLIDLDTMALDQLKREKIKMQLRVLKLQEHYYTLKIKEFKKQRLSLL